MINHGPWRLQWIRTVFPLAALGTCSPLLFGASWCSAHGQSLALVEGSLWFKTSSAKALLFRIGSSSWRKWVGCFTKDLFGVGNAYRGYFNYLEGPGFYFGLTLLFDPAALERIAKTERLLAVGVITFWLMFLFPVFRFAAMGFAAPYFRSLHVVDNHSGVGTCCKGTGSRSCHRCKSTVATYRRAGVRCLAFCFVLQRLKHMVRPRLAGYRNHIAVHSDFGLISSRPDCGKSVAGASNASGCNRGGTNCTSFVCARKNHG